MERVLVAACLLAGVSATCICLEGVAIHATSYRKRILLRILGVAACCVLLLDAFSSGGLIDRAPCIGALDAELAEAYGVKEDHRTCMWVDDCTLTMGNGGGHSFQCRGASQSIDTMLLVTAVANAAMLASLL